MEFASALRAVRTHAPLVQCITNFVTVNDCANILLLPARPPPWRMTSGRWRNPSPGYRRLC